MVDVGVGEKHHIDLAAIDTAEVRVLGNVTPFKPTVDEIIILIRLDVVAAASDLASAPMGSDPEDARR